MEYQSDAISKMEICYDELTSWFFANDRLKPYSAASAIEEMKCSNCDWFCSCKVPQKASKYCRELKA